MPTKPQIPNEPWAADIQKLARLLKSASPLAERLNADETPPAARALLRELLGFNGVFDLSNSLNDLCSETARSMGRGRSGPSRSVEESAAKLARLRRDADAAHRRAAGEGPTDAGRPR